ncbi:MAG: tRNA pseudouridine synthase A [Lentisphaeria bacterium]|nr:tRNA pseudouridine synthase A [Lentisphaeria bacterium]
MEKKKKREKVMLTMNWALTISYYGANYCGWQRQNLEELTSIQEVLEDKLADIFKVKKVTIHGSGRTDAGVHALAQVATFSVLCHESWSEERLLKVLNQKMDIGIAITKVEKRPETFHARFSARGKTYFYAVRRQGPVDAFNEGFYNRYNYPMDIGLIREAAKALEGTHDFSGFACTKKLSKRDYIPISADGAEPVKRMVYDSPKKPEGNVRTIYGIEIIEQGDFLYFVVSGNGFLYKMVRSLVGHLLWIGRGRCKVEETLQVLETKKRTRNVETALARGLYLSQVYYDDSATWKSYNLLEDNRLPLVLQTK